MKTSISKKSIVKSVTLLFSFIFALALVGLTSMTMATTPSRGDGIVAFSQVGSWEVNQAADFDGGTGADTDPWLIATPGQLALMGGRVNSGEPYRSGHFRIIANLDMGAHFWFHVGTATSPFAGRLDAINDATISNLASTLTTSALFQHAGGGNLVIDGLRLSNVNMLGSFLINHLGLGAGVTTPTNAVITNITVISGNISGALVQGGLIANIAGTHTKNITIENIDMHGTINGLRSTAAGQNSAHHAVGGIIGLATAGGTINITNATVTGNVTPHSNTNLAYATTFGVGGIIGSVQPTRIGNGLNAQGEVVVNIIDSSVSGEVSTGAAANNRHAGGFVGTMSGGNLVTAAPFLNGRSTTLNIEGGTVSGRVQARSTLAAGAISSALGGFVGYVDGSFPTANPAVRNITIRDSEVTSTANIAALENGVQMGGLIGRINQTVVSGETGSSNIIIEDVRMNATIGGGAGTQRRMGGLIGSITRHNITLDVSDTEVDTNIALAATGQQVGGMVANIVTTGHLDVSVSDFEYTGNISISLANMHAGGLIANTSVTSGNADFNLENITINGNVTAGTGQASAGGLLGLVNIVTAGFSADFVTNNTEINGNVGSAGATGVVTQGSGAIVGAVAGAGHKSFEIDNVELNGNINSFASAGGLVGYVSGAGLVTMLIGQNPYEGTTNAISGISINGSVTGRFTVGGVVGGIDAAVASGTTFFATDIFISGDITSLGADANVRTGGVLGLLGGNGNDVEITNVQIVSAVVGGTSSSGSNGGVLGHYGNTNDGGNSRIIISDIEIFGGVRSTVGSNTMVTGGVIGQALIDASPTGQFNTNTIEITNIFIENRAGGAAVTGRRNTGGVLGNLTNSHATRNINPTNVTIDNVEIDGNISSLETAASGLIPALNTNTSTATYNISNITIIGDIVAVNVNAGLIGTLTANGANNAMTINIDGIVSHGNIQNPLTTVNGTGGLISTLSGTSPRNVTIDNVERVGNIITSGAAGGLIGRITGAATLNLNIGQDSDDTILIEGSISGGTYVGGVLGYIEQNVLPGAIINIANVEVDGSVTSAGQLINTRNAQTNPELPANWQTTAIGDAGGVIGALNNRGIDLEITGIRVTGLIQGGTGGLNPTDTVQSVHIPQRLRRQGGVGGVIGNYNGGNSVLSISDIEINGGVRKTTTQANMTTSTVGGVVGRMLIGTDVPGRSTNILDISNVFIENTSGGAAVSHSTFGVGGAVGHIYSPIDAGGNLVNRDPISITLSDIEIDGNIATTIAANTLTSHAGGLVSFISANENNTTINVDGITIEGNITNGTINSGGLFATINNTGTANSVTININDVASIGNITTHATGAGATGTGGLIGQVTGTSAKNITIDNIVREGDVTALAKAGGLIGWVSGAAITQLQVGQAHNSTIKIDGNVTGHHVTGGIVAIFDTNIINVPNFRVSNVHITGAITSLGMTTGGDVGGLIGQFGGGRGMDVSINNIRVDGLISGGTRNLTVAGTGMFANGSGGVIGAYRGGGSTFNINEIRINGGVHNNTTTTATASTSKAGGLIGHMNIGHNVAGRTSNTVNISDAIIRNTSGGAAVSAIRGAGGAIGHIAVPNNNDPVNVTIRDFEIIGNVTSTAVNMLTAGLIANITIGNNPGTFEAEDITIRGNILAGTVQAGGLFGHVNSTNATVGLRFDINNIILLGDISGNTGNAGANGMGGIIGNVDGNSPKQFYIDNVYIGGTGTGNITAGHIAGGLIGRIGGTGALTLEVGQDSNAPSNAPNAPPSGIRINGNITGRAHIGGIVGTIDSPTVGSIIRIDDVVIGGVVETTGAHSVGDAGGIIGRLGGNGIDLIIENVVITGRVHGGTAATNVISGVGGIIGHYVAGGGSSIVVRNADVLSGVVSNTTVANNSGAAGVIGYWDNTVTVAGRTVSSVNINNVLVRGIGDGNAISTARMAAGAIGHIATGTTLPMEVTVNNFEVIGNIISTAGAAAGIVPQAMAGANAITFTITNTAIRGNIAAAAIASSGGLFGRINSSNTAAGITLNINNILSHGNVSTTVASSVGTGGLIGHLDGNSPKNITINNICRRGTVSSIGVSGGIIGSVGGAGLMNINIGRASNPQSLAPDAPPSGIRIDGAGTTRGNISAAHHVGGVIGVIPIGITTGSTVNISDVVFNGNISTTGVIVTVQTTPAARTATFGDAGGVIGFMGANSVNLTIDDIEINGNITGGTGTLAGNTQADSLRHNGVGGIIGFANTGSSIINITDTHITGGITNTTTWNNIAESGAGGIIGLIGAGGTTAQTGGTLTHATNVVQHNTINISDVSVRNPGLPVVMGFLRTGGIIGNISSTDANVRNNTIYIEDAHVVGNLSSVVGVGANSQWPTVGGFVGQLIAPVSAAAATHNGDTINITDSSFNGTAAATSTTGAASHAYIGGAIGRLVGAAATANIPMHNRTAIDLDNLEINMHMVISTPVTTQPSRRGRVIGGIAHLNIAVTIGYVGVENVSNNLIPQWLATEANHVANYPRIFATSFVGWHPATSTTNRVQILQIATITFSHALAGVPQIAGTTTLFGYSLTPPDEDGYLEMILPLAEPATAANETFFGWDRTPGGIGSGPFYQPGDALLMHRDTIVHLTARIGVMRAIGYYNYDGTQLLNASVLSGTNHILLGIGSTTRDGFNFGGWRLPDGVTIMQPGDPLLITADTDFTAVWNPIEFSLTFRNLHGTSHTNRDHFTILTPTFSLTAPTARTGWQFEGWYTLDGTVSGNWGTRVDDIAQGSLGNRVFYARWTANTYQIVFDSNRPTGPNGASDIPAGTMPNSNQTWDTAANLPSNNFALTGWTFMGWALSAGGPVVHLDGASVSNLTSVNGGTVTLFAVWQANTFTVVYNGNQPASGPSGTVSGSMLNSVHTFDTASNLRPNTFTLTGWHFTGWATSPGGAVVYGNNISATTLRQGAGPNDPTSYLRLYAVWAPNTFQVQYNPNRPTGLNGSSADVAGNMSNSTHTFDTVSSLDPVVFTLNGWRFDGWATSPGGPLVHAGGAAMTLQAIAHGTTLQLYARWIPNTFTVVYNANHPDATGTMGNSTHTFDTASTLTTNGFVRTGWQFTGWATSPGGALVYANNEVATTLRATHGYTLRLYAVWAPNTNEIIFNNNSGTGTMANQQLATGASANLNANAFARAGYAFIGWAYSQTDANNGIFDYAPGASFTMGTAATVTLFAVWQANVNNIVFNENGGTGTMANQPLATGVTANLTLNAFSKTGHTFGGWATSATDAVSGTVAYANGASFTMGTAATVTLWAIWNINSYTVTFEGDGGTLVSGDVTQTVNHGDNAVPPVFERAGFTRTGWSASYTNITGALIITAVWTANNNTITFMGNGHTGGSMTAQTLATNASDNLTVNAFVRTGHTFGGWATSQALAIAGTAAFADEAMFTMGTGDVTLWAVWNIISYTVTFVGGGGTLVSGDATQSVNHGANAVPPVFEREGWTFNGWSAAYTNITGPVTITALWTANLNTITFNGNGFTGGAMGTQQILTGDTANLIANGFVRAGFTHAGWATTEALANAGVFAFAPLAPFTMGTGDVTLWAVWTANNNTVVFNANGGMGTMSNQTIATGATDDLYFNEFTRAGFAFGGWATSQANANNNIVAHIDGATFTMGTAATVNLWAVWTPNLNTITFNGNGHTGGSMAVQQILTNASANLNVNAFTRDGFTFIGWAYDQNDANNGTFDYGPGASFTMGTAATVTLWAVWQANVNGIIFNANGGIGNMPSQPLATGTSANLITNTFTRAGFTFIGWAYDQNDANNGDFDYAPEASFTMGTDPMVTLFAVWQANLNEVIFNGNGHTSGTMANQEIATNASAALNANTFIRTGFTLIGWAYGQNDANNGDFDYAPGASFTMGTAATVTLYAVWQANLNDVIFNNNGGTGTMPNQEIATNASANLTPNSFTKVGHTFGGWALSAGGTLAYADGASFTMGTGDVTLWAIWNINSYTVTFAGGIGATLVSGDASQSVNHGGDAVPPVFEREGFTRTGWSAPYTNITGDVTINAVWTANINTITFRGNGNTGGSMADQEIATNASANLNANGFIRDGFTHIGWATTEASANAGTVDYAPGVSFTMGTAPTVELWAVWQAVTNSIIFSANGGTGTMPPQSLATGATAPLSTNAFNREGFNFAGWAYDQTNANNGIIDYLQGANFTMGTDFTVTLFAVWTARNNTITFMGNGHTGGSMTAQTLATNAQDNLTANGFTRTGHTFGGWATSQALANAGTAAYADEAMFTMGTGDVTLWAVWNINSYTVTFAGGGAGAMLVSGDASQSVNHGANAVPPVFERAGWTFNGWSAAYTNITGPVTITALWTANLNTIIFNGNNHTGGAMGMQQILTGDTAPLIANGFVRTGFTHAGWATTEALANAGAFEFAPLASFTMGTAPTVTLWAVWTANDNTVVFNANGGTGTMPSQTIATNASANLYYNEFTFVGHTFGGWATSQANAINGVVAHVDGASFTMGTAATVNLWAVWNINSYTVTFAGNGGTLVSGNLTQTVNHGSDAVPPVFTLAGFTRTGWSASYTNITGPVTITAVWTANNNTITFNGNGNTGGSMAPQTLATNAEANLTYNVFVNTGHIFLGWALTQAGAVAYADGALFTMGTTNVTLWAVWGVGQRTVTFEGGPGATLVSGTLVHMVNHGNAVTNPPVFERAGFTQTGWSVPLTNITSDVTITPVWAINTNTIVFHANGGTGVMTNQLLDTNAAADLNINDFVRRGHTFQGWATSLANANAGTIAYADQALFTMGTAATVTLFAVWTVNTYHITFSNLSGGAANNQTTFTVNDLPITLQDATRRGWEFIGWYDALTGGSAVTMIDDVGSITIFARWAAEPIRYTVTFRDVDAGEHTNIPSFTVTDLANNPIILNNAEREGYTFLGWFTADGMRITQITDVGNVVLFARWESDSESFPWWWLATSGGVGATVAVVLWLAVLKKKMLGGR